MSDFQRFENYREDLARIHADARKIRRRIDGERSAKRTMEARKRRFPFPGRHTVVIRESSQTGV